MNLTSEDRKQLADRGSSENELQRQLAIFASGIRAISLDRACTVDDGILTTDQDQQDMLISLFDTQAPQCELVTFVPASGAASRMFKHLHNAKDGEPLFEEFKNALHDFPFAIPLSAKIQENGGSMDELIASGDWQELCRWMLEDTGLGYGSVPKGMVHFHDYGSHQRTAFEEQVHECAAYIQGSSGGKIHFTVPVASLEAVKSLLDACMEELGSVDISYSIQEPFSDTVAVDLNNQLVRDERGELVFRPGGHGALIHNLNAIDADIIFIKNIDNVAPERLRADTIRYKKILGGLALDLVLLRNELLTDPQVGEMTSFIRKYFDPDFSGSGEEAIELLDRPLRVCGMVPNTGEPGGGPYWVHMLNGEVRCQIVEKAQIDTQDPDQASILQNSTHFNPVDLVCCVKGPDGSAYDLTKYIDDSTSFISEKSLGGVQLKALELPGLWNGAMARWNTVFVEVPITTFSPVKTVNDLLREEHRA